MTLRDATNFALRWGAGVLEVQASNMNYEDLSAEDEESIRSAVDRMIVDMKRRGAADWVREELR